MSDITESQVEALIEKFEDLLEEYDRPKWDGIINSTEAFFAYRLLLGRNPFPENELEFILKPYQTLNQFIENIIGSEEFKNTSGYLPANNLWMAELDKIRLWFDTGDRELGYRMALGTYGADVAKVIEETLKTGNKAVDIGAGIGYFSLLMATKVGATGSVHAFEPMDKLYKVFEKNIAENKFGKIIKPKNVAVLDEKGKKDFWLMRNTCIMTELEGRESVSIETVKIDDQVKDKVHLVKINAEGAEPDIIYGAEGLLTKSKPTVIVTLNGYWLKNVSDVGARDVVSLLEDMKFEVFNIDDRKKALKSSNINVGETEMITVVAKPKK